MQSIWCSRVQRSLLCLGGLAGLIVFSSPARPAVDGATNPAPASVSAPRFTLPRWKTGEPVQLADFAGRIVVLDFFAYWCVPCKRASAEIEEGIQRHYAARRGNARGIPVQVLSINIEPDNPALTEEFIRQTGIEQVLNDPGGALLEQFGGAGTPFLVILDGTEANAGSAAFPIRYRHSGFEGLRRLRAVIDGIAGTNPPALRSLTDEARRTPNSGAGLEPRERDGAPLEQQFEVAFDAAGASDVQLATLGAGYRWKQRGTEWRLGYVHSHYAVDYQPYRRFDFLGSAESLSESLNGFQAGGKQRVGDRLTFQAGGSAYDGFTDYRSLWLANYYRQQFSFVPGYETPHPRGFNGSGGVRWEYQPTTGFIEGSFRYANDEIAPGYELDQGTAELRRGRRLLHTYAPSVKLENVLTSRVRTQHEFELRITSAREHRYLYRGSINIALGERWGWRTSGGYTHENPALRAWFAGSTLEFAVTRRWNLNLFGLHYKDTGEIENSLFISTAAPGVRTYQAGAGLRYTGEQTSFSLSIAPLRTDYDDVTVGTRPFTNLYRDRTWLYVQAAWNAKF